MNSDKIDARNIFSAQGKEMPRAEQPMNYTGVRVERYQTARAGRQALGVEGYRRAIRDLNVQERRAVAQRTRREAQAAVREAARALEEARIEREHQVARERRREEVRVARNLRRRQARAVATARRDNVVLDISRRGGWTTPDEMGDARVGDFAAEALPAIMAACTRLIGVRRAYIHITIDGELLRQELITPRGHDARAVYFNSVRPFLYEAGSDLEGNLLTGLDENQIVRLVIMVSDEIPIGRVLQRYLDGVNHCVLEPLAMLWKSMGDNSESPASAKRCHQISRRLMGLKSTYPTGVPEGLDMEAVARVAHRCLVLHDILGNEIKRYNAKSNKYFYFTNTRINHLEEGRLTLDKMYERVTASEISKILIEHDKDSVFYLFSGNAMTGECQTLRSVRGCWAVFNEDYDLFQKFNEETGVDKYGIDAVRHSSLNEFLLESRVINSAPTPLCDNPNDMEDVQQIDIEKAYTQHKFAPVYRGFLGHITDFVVLPRIDDVGEFLESHVGVFRFGVVNEPCALLKTLGIKKGMFYTLPSPEIEYFMGMGLVVRLMAGCWGSTFDIAYSAEMLENRRYCMWAGKLGMDKCDNSYTFKGDKEWASCLRDMLGEDNVSYFAELGMISVSIPKKGYKTRHHILAFITSYTRMNLLETMQKVDGTLVKVVLDGLYYRGNLPDIKLPIHKDKKNIVHAGFREHWYYPARSDISEWESYDKTIDTPAGCVKNVCVLTGAGGTGKSHSILSRKSIPRVLYVVPTNMLGRKMRAKWGCEYTSIHKLIGNDSGDYKCRPFYEDHYEPAVVFLDELTMIEKGWVEKALAMYPNTRFYIAGDIDADRWYQCRNGYPGKFSDVWLPTKEHYCKEYTTDFRSRDSELKEFKQKVRFVMRNVFTDGEQMDANRVAGYVRKNYTITPFDEAVAMFQVGDVWIAGTHKTNEKLLAAGVVSGYLNAQKEIVMEGEGEKRGSFTTHSFQGLTLETERVFVSLDFFEYAMLYTSISRVCTMSQLVIVG
jgi:hypothetical protein